MNEALGALAARPKKQLTERPGGGMPKVSRIGRSAAGG
jgi:hypothetical protein